MLRRRAHYWLYCTEGQLDNLLPQLHGVQPRVARKGEMSEPGRKYPSDYLFVDSRMQDEPIEFVLNALLDDIEPNVEVLRAATMSILGGIKLCIETDSTSYVEELGTEVLSRVAKTGIGLTFSVICMQTGTDT